MLEAKDNGADQVLVEAFYGNEAIDFYQRVGFQPTAVTLQVDL